MSTDRRPRVLLVDDDVDFCSALTEGLSPLGYDVSWRDSAEAALTVVDGGDWDVVLTDFSLAGMNGLALCERVVANHPDLPVVIITAFGSLETAVGAMRAGAFDFVTKPFAVDVLAVALVRAVRHHRLHAEVKRLREVGAKSEEMEGMIGASPTIRRVFDLVDRVADTDATVLVTGASGTGKELVARALHRRSHRKNAPFVAVNCAAIPESLLESELFGHVKGAFTDARQVRRGLFQKAAGGTLFLDEIADMPVGMQAKLLRVLQSKTVRAVGGDVEEPYDARIIAATNRDIEAEVEQHRFREDLYYRLNVIRADLPPLTKRDHDLLLMAQKFLTRANEELRKPHVRGLSAAVAAKLLAYSWPGNVRELKNCIERAVILARGDDLTVEDLPETIQHHQVGALAHEAVAPAMELFSLDEVERRHILGVLKAVGGNKAAAAAVLGVHQSTLYRKLEQYAGRRVSPGRTLRTVAPNPTHHQAAS